MKCIFVFLESQITEGGENFSVGQRQVNKIDFHNVFYKLQTLSNLLILININIKDFTKCFIVTELLQSRKFCVVVVLLGAGLPEEFSYSDNG